MKWFNVLAARFRALVRRDEVLNDIDEEMRAHIEMETEANRALGMTPDEARRSAAKSFGNVGSIRDLAYEVKGGGFMETFWQDVRYSARMLIKHPGFALIAVFTITLGIGEYRDLQHCECCSTASVSISATGTVGNGGREYGRRREKFCLVSQLR